MGAAPVAKAASDVPFENGAAGKRGVRTRYSGSSCFRPVLAVPTGLRFRVATLSAGQVAEASYRSRMRRA
jgi:hypothetical protein